MHKGAPVLKGGAGCAGLLGPCPPPRTAVFRAAGSRRTACSPQTVASAASSSTAVQPGLIFSTGAAGAWDEAAVGHPVVRYYLGDNEQRWFMWYSGRSPGCHDADDLFPASGSVGLAVSTDGLTWTRGPGAVAGDRGEGRALDVGKVLGPNGDWWWHDTCHLHAGDVQVLSSSSVATGVGVYWMFYSGGSFEEATVPEGMLAGASGAGSGAGPREGLRLRPGLAMSQDGRNWARIEADHHTGALFDVGAEGEWDELFIGAPQVVAAGPRDMRMYYHSYDAAAGRYVVGAATSPDGFKWEKRGPIFKGGSRPGDFDEMGAAARCVIRDIDTKQYLMFYEGVSATGSRSIGLASSSDGLTGWRRHPEPVLAPSGDAGAWDAGAVGSPWAVSMAKGRWRLYYAGRQQSSGGGWQGIGVALSDQDAPPHPDGIPVSFRRRAAQ